MARETWDLSHVEPYQKLWKWYLMSPCLTLSIIRYGSRVKWRNPGKEVAPFPTPWCSSYRKGSLRVTLDNGYQLDLFTSFRQKTIFQRSWFSYISVSCYRSGPCPSPEPLFCPNLIASLPRRGRPVGFRVQVNSRRPSFRRGVGNQTFFSLVSFKKFFGCVLNILYIYFDFGSFLLPPPLYILPKILVGIIVYS